MPCNIALHCIALRPRCQFSRHSGNGLQPLLLPGSLTTQGFLIWPERCEHVARDNCFAEPAKQ